MKVKRSAGGHVRIGPPVTGVVFWERRSSAGQAKEGIALRRGLPPRPRRRGCHLHHSAAQEQHLLILGVDAVPRGVLAVHAGNDGEDTRVLRSDRPDNLQVHGGPEGDREHNLSSSEEGLHHRRAVDVTLPLVCWEFIERCRKGAAEREPQKRSGGNGTGQCQGCVERPDLEAPSSWPTATR